MYNIIHIFCVNAIALYSPTQFWTFIVLAKTDALFNVRTHHTKFRGPVPF